MKEIMISVNPPYADMIISGEKPMEFRKQVLNNMKDENNLGTIKAYIYETRNGGGRGKVIGEAIISFLYEVGYGTKKDTEYVLNRSKCICNLYFNWCYRNDIKPNMNEGWYKSKKFNRYLDKIGYGTLDFNYAIVLKHFQPYDPPLPIGTFTSTSGLPMLRPPQNMCRCIKETSNTFKKEGDTNGRKQQRKK